MRQALATRDRYGAGLYRDNIAARDAAVVGRLRRAGAVLVGKPNTQEYAYRTTGEASFLGPTRNPHDPGRISGGSSGEPTAAGRRRPSPPACAPARSAPAKVSLPF